MIDVNDYRENGFVLEKGFFPPEEVEQIYAEAKEVFTLQMRRLGIVGSRTPHESEFEAGMFKLFEADLQTFTNCGKQAQHLISLHRLSLDERIVSALKELGLEFPNISTRPLLYFNASPRRRFIGGLIFTKTGAACKAPSTRLLSGFH
jgi:hypothetical protein